MGEAVKTMFSSFTEVIGSLANGIKNAFMNILYVDPEAETKVLSDPVQFFLIFGGVTLAIGLVMGAFKFFKSRA